MTTNKPTVMLVGGIDVDARIPLMKRLQADFEVSAAGSAPEQETRFRAAGFTYHNYPLSRGVNPVTDLLTVFTLFRLFRRERPAIVHAFDTKPCIYARVAAWLARVPVIVGTLPGLGSLYTDESRVRKIIRWIYEKQQKFASAVSDLTIFQNKDDARQFNTAGIVSETRSRIIFGSGIETDVFSPSRVSEEQRRALRTESNIEADAVVVTLISRLIRSKGVLTFAEAAQLLDMPKDRVCFLLVGPHDESSPDRLTDAELAHLQNTVLWAGMRRDVATVLAASDIFVLPTSYREGIPRVLLEAASMGLPIITTDSPGCNVVVENGMNGILLQGTTAQDLAAAIKELIASPAKRQSFGAVSRQRAVELFDLGIITQQIRECYLGLLR